MIRIFLILLLFIPAPVNAQEKPQESDPIRIKSPVACTIGADCWITRYPNTAAPGTPPKDFKCGALTDADSTGIDIALRDAASMQAGVNILAVANGKIMNVRDDIDDAPADDAKIKSLKAEKRACGNGVFIDHGKGWQSIYCHLKKGSIKVKKGDEVKSGAILAQAGQSGAAPLPQIHFSLFHNGKAIDPFTGLETGTGCGQEGSGLWSGADVSYQEATLYGAGFAGNVPDFSAIKSDAVSPAEMDGDDLNAFSFWGGILGAQPGDKLTLEITRPDGTPLSRKEFVQKDTRPRQFYYTGRKLKPRQLTPGDYTGTATLTRTMADGTSTSKTVTRTVKIN